MIKFTDRQGKKQRIDTREILPKKDPSTLAEWQECVDAAEFLIAIDSCRQYGLLESDLVIDIDRCCELLARGKAAGILPHELPALIAKYVPR